MVCLLIFSGTLEFGEPSEILKYFRIDTLMKLFADVPNSHEIFNRILLEAPKYITDDSFKSLCDLVTQFTVEKLEYQFDICLILLESLLIKKYPKLKQLNEFKLKTLTAVHDYFLAFFEGDHSEKKMGRFINKTVHGFYHVLKGYINKNEENISDELIKVSKIYINHFVSI